MIDEDSCNPYSEAKFEDGKCICVFPYTGVLCEVCMPGYKEEKMEDAEDETHVMCVGDGKSENFSCNGHGEIYNGKCRCHKEYAGDHCDRCS